MGYHAKSIDARAYAYFVECIDSVLVKTVCARQKTFRVCVWGARGYKKDDVGDAKRCATTIMPRFSLCLRNVRSAYTCRYSTRSFDES